ncbi:MAG: hypothetical protein HY401_04155 [Elusimicrobia bacterium]|nr:hypothetical protein [Elusimicrobiota bacterium]
MFRLRKTEPPFGTEQDPLWEHAYAEEVKVVDGICEVQDPTSRDYLLKMGYSEAVPAEGGGEEIKEKEPVAVTASEEQKQKPSPKPKSKGKARR